jgi:hypothetical protein
LRARQRRLSRLAERDPEGRALVDGLDVLGDGLDALRDELREQARQVTRARAELDALRERVEWRSQVR